MLLMTFSENFGRAPDQELRRQNARHEEQNTTISYFYPKENVYGIVLFFPTGRISLFLFIRRRNRHVSFSEAACGADGAKRHNEAREGSLGWSDAEPQATLYGLFKALAGFVAKK